MNLKMSAMLFCQPPSLTNDISYGDFNISLAYVFHVANSLSLINTQSFNNWSLKPDKEDLGQFSNY